MRFDETTLTMAGVIRCCLQSIADQFQDEDKVDLGDKAECKYCHTKFTLVQPDPARKPRWVPDWQIENPTP